MSTVLTVRIAPGLLAKAEARAVRLGLDRAGYVRSLIEHDLKTSAARSLGQFASEDLVGAFRLGGKSATNRVVRKTLKRLDRSGRETDR
jgi:superfamily II RNA helicase